MEDLSAPTIFHFTLLQEAAAFPFSTKLFAQAEAGFFIPAGKPHSSRKTPTLFSVRTLAASYSFNVKRLPLNKWVGC